MAFLISERDRLAVLIDEPGEWRRGLSGERRADDVGGGGNVDLGGRGRRMRTHRQRHEHPDRHASGERDDDNQRLAALGSSKPSEAPRGFHPYTSLSVAAIRSSV